MRSHTWGWAALGSVDIVDNAQHPHQSFSIRFHLVLLFHPSFTPKNLSSFTFASIWFCCSIRAPHRKTSHHSPPKFTLLRPARTSALHIYISSFPLHLIRLSLLDYRQVSQQDPRFLLSPRADPAIFGIVSSSLPASSQTCPIGPLLLIHLWYRTRPQYAPMYSLT